jgi:Cys-rich repeat protein
MLYRCVACLDNSHCANGYTCDVRMRHCLESCTDDASCSPGAHGCSESKRTCYQCDENEECLSSPTGKVCAKDGSGCVECSADLDCPGKRCDQLTGRCVDCYQAADCPSKLCDVTKGECL